MKVLVATASRHGSTREIGQWIAQELRRLDIECDQADAADVEAVDGYDAVILGSAVYVGQWLGEAKGFAERFAHYLGDKKVWLFSSGLADVPSNEANGTTALRARMELTGAVGHRHFSGKLDVLQLSLAERAAIMAARGKYGDARDRDAVCAWTREIAEALSLSHARS